jgi:hypothetical protein
MVLSRWFVRLSLDEGEAGPISRVITAALRPEIHGMSIGRGPLDEPDEPGTFTIEIDGANANDARVRSQHLLGELQTLAGLSKRLAPTVWVAPLSDDHPSSLRFLSEAESLIGDERYEMAVVASQIHLEIQVRVLIEAAIEAGSEKTLAIILRERPAWSPHDRIVEAILDSLLGVRVKDYPGWGDYMAHVKRRRAVVHGGQAIDEESARASVAAVSGFWLWLSSATRSCPGQATPGPSA